MNFERRRGPAQLRRRASSRQSHFLHSSADIFVGTGFRFWLTGLRTGDLSHWERAFALSANVLGIETARDVCRDFSQWVRVISERSRRDLKTLDPDNPCFCRDECVAMAVVAAYQHKGCPALQACALTPLPKPALTVSLPLNPGWYDGQAVFYITTEVSDAAVAREKGAIYAPRLADALPRRPRT